MERFRAGLILFKREGGLWSNMSKGGRNIETAAGKQVFGKNMGGFGWRATGGGAACRRFSKRIFGIIVRGRECKLSPACGGGLRILRSHDAREDCNWGSKKKERVRWGKAGFQVEEGCRPMANAIVFEP